MALCLTGRKKSQAFHRALQQALKNLHLGFIWAIRFDDVVGPAGQVNGEEAMMAEIATRGPIACGICVTPQFEAYAGGIYKDTQECTTEMHVIAVEGYGEENGTPYWLGRNRWAVTVMCFEHRKVGRAPLQDPKQSSSRH